MQKSDYGLFLRFKDLDFDGNMDLFIWAHQKLKESGRNPIVTTTRIARLTPYLVLLKRFNVRLSDHTRAALIARNTGQEPYPENWYVVDGAKVIFTLNLDEFPNMPKFETNSEAMKFKMESMAYIRHHNRKHKIPAEDLL